MKTLLKISFYLFVVLLVSVSACKKQKLPSGDHSFYCYIDGELFVPKGDPNFTTSPYDDGLRISITDNFYQIEANDYRKYTVFINIKDIHSSVINLSESSGSFLDFEKNHAIVKKNGVKYLSKNNSGRIVLIENTGENVKGTFEFTLYNENDDSDVIHVTGGHFDD